MKKRWSRPKGMQNTYRWAHCSDPALITLGSAGTANYQVFNFKLTDITDYTAYTSIFDQY